MADSENEWLSVDWSKIGHAYGSADDIPAILSRICEADPEDAREAVFELGLRIANQGGAVSEATPYAFPLLLRIAADPVVPVRADVLRLLIKIVRSGRAWHSAARHSAEQYKGNYTERLGWEDLLLNKVVESMHQIHTLDGDDRHLNDLSGQLENLCNQMIDRAQGTV